MQISQIGSHNCIFLSVKSFNLDEVGYFLFSIANFQKLFKTFFIVIQKI